MDQKIEERVTVLDNLKKVICEHPEVDLIVLNRLIYIRLMYEIHGNMRIKDVRIHSDEEVKVDEVDLYGETATKLKKDLRV